MDIEEQVTLSDAQKLVARLNKDFPKQFIITMSPVARISQVMWVSPGLTTRTSTQFRR
jgi:hypothetical protein